MTGISLFMFRNLLLQILAVLIERVQRIDMHKADERAVLLYKAVAHCAVLRATVGLRDFHNLAVFQSCATVDTVKQVGMVDVAATSYDAIECHVISLLVWVEMPDVLGKVRSNHRCFRNGTVALQVSSRPDIADDASLYMFAPDLLAAHMLLIVVMSGRLHVSAAIEGNMLSGFICATRFQKM